MSGLRHAFKEWAVICRALAEGRQALILRKGGIEETGGTFEVEHSRFWLYPTYTEAQRVFPSITGIEEYVFERKANRCDGITSKEKRTSCSADQGVYLPGWPTPTMIVDTSGVRWNRSVIRVCNCS